MSLIFSFIQLSLYSPNPLRQCSYLKCSVRIAVFPLKFNNINSLSTSSHTNTTVKNSIKWYKPVRNLNSRRTTIDLLSSKAAPRGLYSRLVGTMILAITMLDGIATT